MSGRNERREHAQGRIMARIRHRNFSAVWLIPIVAGAIALWLGWRAWQQNGPLITLSFSSGDGLTAGQTGVKYKAVQLGTVDSVRLSDDMSHVEVKVRMRAEAEARLTDHARFWVVRPRINSGNVSGLETLVSGAYIAMDPGEPGGRSVRHFIGLENPPGRRSDEPGTTYTLLAGSIGSIGQGSPVFYRDIAVGEVLGYDQPKLRGQITVHVFVRKPYDRYVRDDSRFWNSSGVKVSMGGGGIHVQMQSAQALLSGGVTFSTPPESRDEPPAKPDVEFQLYKDYDAAVAATSRNRILAVSYLAGSVRGLDEGSTVEIDGMRIGSVIGARLEYDVATHDFRVPVHMALEPDLLSFADGARPEGGLKTVLNDLLARGLRAELQSASFVTGAKVLALMMPPNAKPAPVAMENGEIVIPGQAGGVDSIVASLSDIATKLDRVPFDEIGRNVDRTLDRVSKLIGGPEVRNAVRDLSATLASVRHLVGKTDAGLDPVLKQLPEVERHLDQTLARANALLGSQGYGHDSGFQRDVSRLIVQANDTLRAIRGVADLLGRHPEALLRGRAGEGARR